MTREEVREEILSAIARGWCSPKNEQKVMDPVLAEAIADEILLEIDKIVLPEKELFKRIWQAIKHWDIDNGRKTEGTDIGGYGGVTGDDVRLIIQAITEPVLSESQK